MTSVDQLPRFEIADSRELWSWLEKNHGQEESVWLVTWKKSAGNRYVSRQEILPALLSYGWIDSLPRKLDENRTMLLISRRRPGSSWSKVNRQIVEKLIDQGRMMNGGMAAIDLAKLDGSWDRLNDVEELFVPDDLANALVSQPQAQKFFKGFPPSSQRGILEWVQSAKRPETRARRISEIVEKAARNIKANHPKGRDRGPPESSGK